MRQMVWSVRQDVYRPSRSFWGTHSIIFTFSGTPPGTCPVYLHITCKKRSSAIAFWLSRWFMIWNGEIYHSWTFCGICLKASRKTEVVSSGISDTMVPRVNTMNPCSPDTQDAKSYKHTHTHTWWAWHSFLFLILICSIDLPHLKAVR